MHDQKAPCSATLRSDNKMRWNGGPLGNRFPGPLYPPTLSAHPEPVALSSFCSWIDKDEIKFGAPSKLGFVRVIDLSIRGKAVSSDITVRPDPSALLRVVACNRSIIGVADYSFPHPDDWSLGDCSLSFPKISVKALTKLFSHSAKPIPNCWKAWQDRFTDLSPNPPIGLLYSDTLLGPADYYNHFKFITHRALARIIAMDRATPCPLCNGSRNQTSHYTKCNLSNHSGPASQTCLICPP